MIAGIFVSSCGLEEVITLNYPTVTNNDPLYTSSETTGWWFGFVTEESDQPDEFIGTDIYYKIYSNSGNLTSQRSAILALNTLSNGSSAATKMIDTYTYKSLGVKSSTGNSVLIPKTGENRSVVIRLKSYLDSISTEDDRYTLTACMGVKSGTTYNYSFFGDGNIPYRNGNSTSFDFFDYDDDDDSNKIDVEPSEGDSDYYYNSSFSKTDCYYVQMFAVGIGWNSSTCTSVYSLVLDLGSVPIEKGQ